MKSKGILPANRFLNVTAAYFDASSAPFTNNGSELELLFSYKQNDFNINVAHVASFHAFLCLSGKHIVAPPLPGIENTSVPDKDDLPFAEAALAGEAAIIVTG